MIVGFLLGAVLGGMLCMLFLHVTQRKPLTASSSTSPTKASRSQNPTTPQQASSHSRSSSSKKRRKRTTVNEADSAPTSAASSPAATPLTSRDGSLKDIAGDRDLSEETGSGKPIEMPWSVRDMTTIRRVYKDAALGWLRKHGRGNQLPEAQCIVPEFLQDKDCPGFASAAVSSIVKMAMEHSALFGKVRFRLRSRCQV